MSDSRLDETRKKVLEQLLLDNEFVDVVGNLPSEQVPREVQFGRDYLIRDCYVITVFDGKATIYIPNEDFGKKY